MSNESIVERRLMHQKLRRKARRGEIAIRRIYKLLRFLIILFIFYSVYRISFLHYWYLPSGLFDKYPNEHIEILGNNIVSADRILSEIKGLEDINKPIYKINPSSMSKKLEELSAIKRAYIRRFWMPARFVIMLEEEIPIITIAPSEDAPDVAAYSYSGKYIGREFLPFNESIKTLRVLSYGNKGDDYEKWDKEKINKLYKLYKLLEEYTGEQVKYLDLRNPHDVYACIESFKLRLGEIDTTVFDRIKSIHDILPEVKQRNLKVKYVDLSWKEAQYIKEDVGNNID